MDHRDDPRGQSRGSRSPAGRPAGQGASASAGSAKARARARRKARQRRARNRVVVCLCAVILCVVGALGIAYGLPSSGGPAVGGDSTTAGADASNVSEATPAPTPTPDPAAERIEQATARNIANATKDAPEVKDPDTWQQNAVTLLEGLQASEEYSDLPLPDRGEPCVLGGDGLRRRRRGR